jgi:hypothetical protein
LDTGNYHSYGECWLKHQSDPAHPLYGQRGKFMSCKIEPAREQQEAPPPVAKPKPAARQDDPFGDMPDDLPFANPYRGRMSLIV